MHDLITLRRVRAEKVAAMEAVITAAGDDMGEDDQKAFDGLKAEIDKLDGRIERLVALEAAKAKEAKPVVDVTADVTRAAPAALPAQPKAQKVAGTDFTRIVRSLVASKGIGAIAAQYAENTYGPEGKEIAKALGAATGTAGGFLVPPQYSAEIIELLRNRTVVRAAGATVMPIPGGSVMVPKLTGTASASWVGENTNIGSTGPTFGGITLSAKTLAATIPISNQLIRYSSPQADAVVRDDVVNSLSITEDATYLRNQGIGAAPKGMRYWANSGNVIATAGTSSANVETDLKAAIQALEGNNVRMLKPVWIMAPRTKNHLWTLRNAAGQLIVPEIRDGFLWGYPVFVSNQVPTNLGGGTETELYFADMADCLIGEDTGITVDASDTAAYYDSSAGAVVSSYSQDQTVVRAMLRVDFALRHDRSVSVITGVTWGA